MKKNFGIIFLLLLAAIAAYFYFNNTRSSISSELKEFSIKDTSNIDRIFISKQGGVSADLMRNGNEWTVNEGFKARQDAINLLLETFYRIDVISPVSNNEFETVVKQLASNGTKVEIYSDADGRPDKVYYVGQATENHHGTYMLLEQDGKKSSIPFITYVPGFTGYLSTRFFTEEELWRDRAIFAYEVDDIQRIDFRHTAEPDQSFSIEASDDMYNVLDKDGNIVLKEKSDLMIEYLERFKSVHYEYIDIDMTEHVKDSVLSSPTMYEIEVTNTEGVVRKLKTYYKPLLSKQYDINTGEELTHNLDRCSGWIDAKDFVAIQYIILDELVIKLDDIKAAHAVDK